MMSSLPKIEEIQYCEYADDIAMYITGKKPNTLVRKMQSAIDSLDKFCKSSGFIVNPGKTKAMFFTNRKVTLPQLKISEKDIKYVDEYKYLGIIIDSPKLLWKKHINYLKERVLKRINILKAVSGTKWGADRATLMKLYYSLIRSRLDYGSQLYQTASKTAIGVLDPIQNQCLRIAAGCWKTSPTTALEVECHCAPLFLHREEVSIKYILRLLELPENLNITSVMKENILSNKWRNKKNPCSLYESALITRS